MKRLLCRISIPLLLGVLNVWLTTAASVQEYAPEKPDTKPKVSIDDYQPENLSSVNFLMLSPQIDNRFDNDGSRDESNNESNNEVRKGSSPSERTYSNKAEGPSEKEVASASAIRSPAEVSPSEEAQQEESDREKQEKRNSPAGTGEAETGKAGASGVAASEAEPDEEEPESRGLIRAEEGEHVHLTLPGFGWIYDRGVSQVQGVEFQARNYKGDSTEFVFLARNRGRYTLVFQH